MDEIFITGVAATLSAILVFCGSIWLLLALVLGARLAYFVAASITLAFTLIMGLVWSFGTPLGPVGEMPTWNPVAIGEDAAELNFGPAAQYPDAPWQAPNEDDEAEAARAGELEGEAAEYLTTAIEEGEIETFATAEDAQVADDSTRLLEHEGDEYGALTFEAAEGNEGREVAVVMRYDPGDPLGKARMITAGTFVLFIGHLLGLSVSERRARRLRESLP